MIGAPLLAGAADSGPSGAFTIQRSLRFNETNGTILSRTTSAASGSSVNTFSFWIKNTKKNIAYLYEEGPDVSNRTYIAFTALKQIRIVQLEAGTTVLDKTTQNGLLDYAAWAHIVVAFNRGASVAEDRVIVYVNGVRVTAWSTNTIFNNVGGTWISGHPSYTRTIGATRLPAWGTYLEGYLADFHFVDGMALPATSFGAFDAITGLWGPINYTGMHGTNGYYLKFNDNSAVTAAALGADSSGAGNNWTPNSFVLSGLLASDSMTDTPTPYDDGAYGRGNFATLDLNSHYYLHATPNLGYLQWSGGAASIYTHILPTVACPLSGKWYCETLCVTTGLVCGLLKNTPSNIQLMMRTTGWLGQTADGYSLWTNGTKYNNNSFTSYTTANAVNDVIGIAYDADVGSLTFYRNGVSLGVAFSGLSGEFFFAFAQTGSTYVRVNFGQQPWAYAPPAGYKPLNSYNVPTPAITKPNSYFEPLAYTGNNTARSIVNTAGFQPDLVLIKGRNVASDNKLTDSVRGATKALMLDYNGSETTDAGGVTAFNSNGFSLGTSDTNYNGAASTYVAWQWKKGVTPGVDVVTYTGNATGGRALSHSLGVAPKFIIVKNRSAAGSPAVAWHSDLTAYNYYLATNTTAAQVNGATVWGAAPSSTTFTVGTDPSVNGNTNSMVAFLFAEVPGFSRMGSYFPTGDTNTNFFYCGFKPAFILIKCITTTGNWVVYDAARTADNTVNQGKLLLNTSGVETNERAVVVTSTGFKLDATSTDYNTVGQQFAFVAFASDPFKNSLAAW